MEQGGWRDAKSIMAYSHDVIEHRRTWVAAMDAPKVRGKAMTRGKFADKLAM
jgi:hypothetical protein